MAWDTHPQSARGWLYILKPAVVMKARVNMASATYPAHEITYDGVTVGGYTGIDIGQTILIGSYDGGYDLGWTYLRATPDSDTLPIGWSSKGGRAGEITLTDNAYITVIDTYEVWRKPQRLDTDATIYKDYDLNGTTPPSPIMHVGDLGGLGRVGFTSGGVLTVDAFDWGGSTLVNVGETWADRNWYFVDGTITVGTDTSQAPDVTFPAGKRWVRLYGLGSDGGLTYRRYLVVALDPTTPDVVRFNNIKLRRTAEGQTLTADLHEYLNPDDYPPGSIVMYLAREKRGNDAEIVQRFAGWLDTETSFSQATSTHVRKGTTITAIDVAGRLAQLRALPSVVENAASQSTWITMKTANPERYIHRHLAFESTALNLSDWTLTGLTGTPAYPFISFATTGGTLYGVCDGIAKAFGRRLTCDSNGRLWLKADPMRQNDADRTATVQRHIGEADWKRITWQNRSRASIAVLRTENGVVSSGNAADVLVPFPDVYSIAPGEAAGQGGGESSSERGIVQSQTESNERAGHDYARMTALNGLFTIDMAHGVDAGIEPAAMTWVTVTASADNAGYTGPTLTTSRGLPTTVEISVNAETGVSTQSLTWERETSGQAGTRDPRPAVTGGGTVTPPPPGVVIPPRRTATNGLGLIPEIALFCTSGKVHLMSNMLDLLAGGVPAVVSHSLSLTGTLAGFAVRADSPQYVSGTGAVNGYIATTSQVRTIADIASARTLGTAYSYASGAVVSAQQVNLQTERGNADWALVATYRDTGGVDAYRTTNGGSAWSTESSLPAYYDSNLPNNAGSWSPGLWMSPDGGGNAIVSACAATASPPGADFWETDDYGATWTKITTTGYDADDYPVACIVKPLTAPGTMYHGYLYYTGGSVEQRLKRIVGTTQTDISVSYGGDTYGVMRAGTNPNQRSISVCDEDHRAVVLVGCDYPGSDFGVFQSWNQGDTWNVLIEPGSTVDYRGAYYVGIGLIFLFGAAGAFAVCKYVGGGWQVYETVIDGAGAIVGICGL